MYSVISNTCEGITRYGIKGDSLAVTDITVSEEEAQVLADWCTRNTVSEVHLYDVIEDWFGMIAFEGACS